MKISKRTSHERIEASVVQVSKDDFKERLASYFDTDDKYHGDIQDVVDAIYSDSGYFADDHFDRIEDFVDLNFSNVENPLDIVERFWYGEDLDHVRGEDSGANPTNDYARYDRLGNVETTDNPGRIYFDEILDDIVDYIADHYDDGLDFPEGVQEIIEWYVGYSTDSNDTDDEDTEEEE